FFKAKTPQPYPREYINLEDANEHICKFAEREVAIAKTMGDQQVNAVYNCYKSGNPQHALQIHQGNNIYLSDMTMDEFIRIEHGRCIDVDGLNYQTLTRAYFDIEVDLIDPAHRILSIEEMKELTPAPINMITTIYEKERRCIVQLLDTKNNVSFNKFMGDVEGFKEMVLKDHLLKNDIDKIDVKIYTDEATMIVEYFDIVNLLKPDLMLAWNISFDIRYMINRLRKLGYSDDDLMEAIIHKDFVKKSFYYHDDTRAESNETKSDWFRGSSYTMYICQMLTWIHTRKGRMPDIPGFGLDDVATHEVGEGKWDYSSHGTIYDIAHKNFTIACLYNIIDVVLLKRIENKTNDCAGLFIQAQTTCTEVKNGFKKTVFCKNIMSKEYLLDGLAYENNRNKKYTENVMIQDADEGEHNKIGERKDKFEGAVVGDPNLNMARGVPLSEATDLFKEFADRIKNNGETKQLLAARVGLELEGEQKIDLSILDNKDKLEAFIEACSTGVSKWIFKNIIDFDLSSLYPSIIYAFNISKEGQIGKIFIPEQVSELENPYNNDRYNRGGDFIDDYECGDHLFIGNKWFGLDSIDDMLIQLDEEIGG
ncbi:MAG: 3'-5' exonuclease, partial [Cetobacterium sp.]|uniref:3'-5' exonuclease n=1 Tax=Cetobacterium sp. TaxID=2071632 RepID=UPI003F357F08